MAGRLPKVTSLQSNDIKYYTLQYLVTPLDTLTHRRRTFQPAVMESGSVSYETVFHTMQCRGFAAIYDCYLIFKTRVVSLCDITYRLLHVTRFPANQAWSSCSRCQSKLAIQVKQPREASFSSPSVFYCVISICPGLSSRRSSSGAAVGTRIGQ